MEIYHLDEVSTRSAPFEGHYFHDVVKVSMTTEKSIAMPGDVLIPTDQAKARYVVETLEPEAMDSLFRWNSFGTALQRKESFSPYVFEETATRILADDQKLSDRFKQRKKEEPDFASDPTEQLTFLYRNSQHYESAHRLYLIARLRKIPS